MDNPGLPPQTSNSYCLPGRAGGTPVGIRDAMMHKGLENYLSRCKPMWAGLDHAAFKMLCDKYGSNFTHNIINEYGLHILTGIEED